MYVLAWDPRGYDAIAGEAVIGAILLLLYICAVPLETMIDIKASASASMQLVRNSLISTSDCSNYGSKAGTIIILVSASIGFI